MEPNREGVNQALTSPQHLSTNTYPCPHPLADVLLPQETGLQGSLAVVPWVLSLRMGMLRFRDSECRLRVTQLSEEYWEWSASALSPRLS